MQITNMNIRPIEYEIPVHQDHPHLNSKTIANYEKVLSYSKLKVKEQINHRNVKIHENQYIHQIYTVNGSTLPHMVFLHGYGGTSMTAIRMFEHLYPYFQVHALDAYGIGYSSRGNFMDSFTAEQARDYYVEALQEWRKALRIDKMFLVGHSFGGYLAACYAMKYPNRIEHLFLVSPAGTSQRLTIAREGQELTFRRKSFTCIAQMIYNWNIRPSRAMSFGFIGSKIVKSVLTNRLNIPEEEQKDWLMYFSNVNSQCKSSEVGFYKLFDFPLNPKVTIQTMFTQNPNLPFSTDFYFGDSDWMPKQGAVNLVNKNTKGIQLATVPNAGHQVVFDNAVFLCQKMIERQKSLKSK